MNAQAMSSPPSSSISSFTLAFRAEPQRPSSLATFTPPRLSTAEQEAWTFRSTIAFWVSVWFIQGSALFTVGSVGIFPIVAGDAEYVGEFVEGVFMLGAWVFTLANYFCYFQVINQQADFEEEEDGEAYAKQRSTVSPIGPQSGTDLAHEQPPQTAPQQVLSPSAAAPSTKTATITSVNVNRDTRFIPRLSDITRDFGHAACASNMAGAILFNINTMMPLYGPELDTDLKFNLVYVGVGAAGSLMFALGGVLEGEYNNWRADPASPEAFMSLMNMLGGLLFFVGYIVDVDHHAEHGISLNWGVAMPFTVGSLLFLLTSCMSLWLWKGEAFGLSYAKKLQGYNPWGHPSVDLLQQGMTLVYSGSCVLAWCRLSLVLVHEFSAWMVLDIVLKLLIFHGILFIVSAVHTTPKRRPFNYLIWALRVIAVYALIADSLMLHHLLATGGKSCK